MSNSTRKMKKTKKKRTKMETNKQDRMEQVLSKLPRMASLSISFILIPFSCSRARQRRRDGVLHECITPGITCSSFNFILILLASKVRTQSGLLI